VQTAPVKEGDILAEKYRVERVLGQGGMGVVVAAWHQQLDQRVALKFLLSEVLADEDTVARFMREARASARLRSEHAAKVLDVGKLETGAPYIVMEYLEGRDLDATLESEGPLPIETAVDYVLQACEAVAEAHAAGIVHRDLKPANLFLTTRPDGSPCIKVLDFGISKKIEAEDSRAMTRTKAMLGTPYYMSPEQMRSSRRVDQRSDIWAIGMILCQLTTGRTAFERGTLAELCAAVLSEPPTPPRDLNPSIPPELEAIILRCLEKDADNRFADLSLLCAALASFGTPGSPSVDRVARLLGHSSPRISIPFPPRSSAPDGPAVSVVSPRVNPDDATIQGPSPASLQGPSPASPQNPAPASSSPAQSEHAISTPAVSSTQLVSEPAPPARSRAGLLIGVAVAGLAAAGLAIGLRPGATPTPPPLPSATALAATGATSAPTASATAPASTAAPAVASSAPVAPPSASAPAAAKPTTKAAVPPPVRKPGGREDEFGGRK
jgi:eukaryotic-like serine/threonine-protein kinase